MLLLSIMKEIIEIFKRDIKKIFKSKVAVAILVGMLFIPGIYAWLNIDSNWNPYDNTGNIPIAVVNNDSGVSLFKNDINIGDSLSESLKNNNAMKWTFVEEDTAKEKVENGEYYGAIIIPEDFSSKIATLFDGAEIVKPEFDFYVNNKKNPIAPIIVNKAVGTLETTLDQAFVDAIVYKVIDKAEGIDIGEKGVSTVDGVIVKLNGAKDSIEQLRSTLNVISSASDATISALAAVKDLLPDSGINDFDFKGVRAALSTIEESGSKIDVDIDAVFGAAKELSVVANDAIDKLDAGDAKVKEEISKVSKITNTLLNVLNKEQEIIDSLQDIVGHNVLSELKERNNRAIQKLNELNALLDYASGQGTLILDQIKAKASEANKLVVEAVDYYHNEISSSVKDAMARAVGKIDELVNTFSYIGNAFSKTDSALVNTINALGSVNVMNSNIDTLLLNLENDIDKIIKVLGNADQSDLYLKVMNLLQNTPEDVADFISKPIKTNQIDTYPIADYGSKMAPFYTILAAWVGCTLLVSILKTDIEQDEKNKKTKPYQAFFGRFLLFGLIAVLQGLVIGVGDIVLGVQVLSVPLFLLTIMTSSLVFMLIVFSLTISFGKVGEAMAVILMVIQVAGSGGTFPIELLPNFFQTFQPFMPFYPAMNALRETIGGFYQNSYLLFMLLLLCHTIIPLILGLVIRKPIIKIKAAAEKSIEETEVII